MLEELQVLSKPLETSSREAGAVPDTYQIHNSLSTDQLGPAIHCASSAGSLKLYAG